MSEYQTKLHSVPSGGFLTDRDKDKKPILDVRELGIILFREKSTSIIAFIDRSV